MPLRLLPRTTWTNAAMKRHKQEKGSSPANSDSLRSHLGCMPGCETTRLGAGGQGSQLRSVLHRKSLHCTTDAAAELPLTSLATSAATRSLWNGDTSAITCTAPGKKEEEDENRRRCTYTACRAPSTCEQGRENEANIFESPTRMPTCSGLTPDTPPEASHRVGSKS